MGRVQQRLNPPALTRHTVAESTSDGHGNSTCRDTGHVAHVPVADDNIEKQYGGLAEPGKIRV